MQIAIREDQARFLPQSGTRGTAATAPVKSFDDLVRALGARRTPDDVRTADDDHSARDGKDRRDSVGHRDERRDDTARTERPRHDAERIDRDRPVDNAEPTEDATPHTAEGPVESTAPEAPEHQGGTDQTATTEAPAEPVEATETVEANVATITIEVPIDPVLAATAEPITVPGNPAIQTAAPGITVAPGAPAATRAPGEAQPAPRDGTQPAVHAARPGALPADGPKPVQIMDIASPAQSPVAAAARAPTALAQGAASTAAEPLAPVEGLASTLLAQTLVARPVTTGAPGTAANGTQPASKTLLKAIGKAIGIDQLGQGTHAEEQRVFDFKAVAAALFSRTLEPRGAPRPASGDGGAPTSATSATAAALALGERAASTAQANATSAPSHAARLQAPQFAERIGITIARAAESGVDRVSIRLHPREMGRIDVRMEMGQDGRLNLIVSADRQDTLDQLQRNGRDLERGLNDAGFNTGAGDLSFSLRDQQAQGQQDDDAGSATAAGEENLPDEADAPENGILVTHHDGSLMVVDLFV